MSPGYHTVIRELLSTGCLYVQSAHVDYLQALGFPAAKASSECLPNPSSEQRHSQVCSRLNLLLHHDLLRDIYSTCVFMLSFHAIYINPYHKR